ncbi:MAG: CPBP family glutamic-type intramembrane protease [Alphaproteobacteria bacterium]
MTRINGTKTSWLAQFSKEKLLLAAEFSLVFIGLPLVIVAIKERALLVGLLWIGAFLAYRVTRGLPRLKTDIRQFWRNLRPILLRFAVLAPAVAALTWFIMPDAFLAFPRERPDVWLMVMLLYPLLSVWPQEMIFRAFLFHRYAPLFGRQWGYVAASALAFGYGHMILLNGVAVVMSAIGGFLFARDYARNQSLLLVCLEHTLYGCLIFTVGLGRFFYSGAVWN